MGRPKREIQLLFRDEVLAELIGIYQPLDYGDLIFQTDDDAADVDKPPKTGGVEVSYSTSTKERGQPQPPAPNKIFNRQNYGSNIGHHSNTSLEPNARDLAHSEYASLALSTSCFPFRSCWLAASQQLLVSLVGYGSINEYTVTSSIKQHMPLF